MSELGTTGWEEPAPKPTQSPEEILAARFADREDPDDMDDMRQLSSGEAPGYIEVPDWNEASADPVETAAEAVEQAEPGKYDGYSDEYIKLAANRNMMQRKVLMHEFLDSVMEDVKAGIIKSSKGETYTADRIRRRFASLFQGLTQPVEGKDPLIELPRSQGLRSTVDALFRDGTTAKPLLDALEEYLRTPASPEVRSTDKVTEVGGKTVEVAGVANPAETEVKDPFDDFTEADQTHIASYRRARSDFLVAHNKGDGVDAKREKELMAFHEKGMTRAAKAYLKLI